MVPSNIPTVTIDDIAMSGGEVTIPFTAQDKEEYEDVPLHMPTNTDITILLGDTSASDLKYRYNLRKDGAPLITARTTAAI